MAKLTGTNPDQVPTNADLGDMAYQSKDNVSLGGGKVTGDITVQDNKKIYFGTDNDMNIGHGGANGSINNATGNIGYNSNQHIFGDVYGTERMRIDSSGSVGIGTNSPNGKLDITGSGNTDLYLNTGNNSGDNTRIFFGDTADIDVAYLAYDHGTNSMLFGVNASEAMRIDSSGNLLIGTTTVTSAGKLQLTSSSTYYGFVDRAVAAIGLPAAFFNQGGTLVGSITHNGSSTSYNTSSDYRLKENVVELTGATTRLKQLEPKRFNFIADADTTVDGFLAHEVQGIVPEAITGTHNEVDADGNPVYQGIDQSKLVPLLVATIKELEARITALEAN